MTKSSQPCEMLVGGVLGGLFFWLFAEPERVEPRQASGRPRASAQRRLSIARCSHSYSRRLAQLGNVTSFPCAIRITEPIAPPSSPHRPVSRPL
jgi:hypothetical protein